MYRMKGYGFWQLKAGMVCLLEDGSIVKIQKHGNFNNSFIGTNLETKENYLFDEKGKDIDFGKMHYSNVKKELSRKLHPEYFL